MKKGYLRKNCIVLCLAMLLMCCFAGCGSGAESKNDTLPDSGSASMLSKPESDKTENSETTEAGDDTESKENANLIDGMRPEFKEAMDSYEDFMNDYCDFMKKYNQSPTDLSLLADYTSYMSKYAETMKKIEAIDESELSDAELNYYLEVTGRVTEKIVDLAM